jgi:zinc protease
MNGNASPDDLETLFALVHLGFSQTRFDDVGLERDRRDRQANIQNRLTSPNSVFRDKFNEVMYDSHPRRMPWTLETLDEMNLDTSKGFYEERFANAGDFTFVLVGAFELDEMESLVSTYIASLPGSEERESAGDDGSRRVSGVHEAEVAKGIEQKSYFQLEFHGDFDYNADARSQLYGMKAVLSTLLREELREELGGVYGVSVSNGTWQHPTPGYRLSVSFSCDPSRVDELKAATFEVLEQFRNETVDAHYVDQEKEKNRRSHETQLVENSYWLGQLLGAYRRNEDPRQILEFDTRNDRLTPDFIQEAAGKYIDLDQYVQVILRPEDSETE